MFSWDVNVLDGLLSFIIFFSRAVLKSSIIELGSDTSRQDPKP